MNLSVAYAIEMGNLEIVYIPPTKMDLAGWIYIFKDTQIHIDTYETVIKEKVAIFLRMGEGMDMECIGQKECWRGWDKEVENYVIIILDKMH